MRLNKYPFFLWLTQERDDLKVDFANNKVYSDVGQSSIKRVPLFLIILMKYMPLAFLSYFFFIPRNLFEVGLAFISFGFIVILYYLINYEWVFKGVILAFCVMNFYFVFAIDDYASHLSTALTLFTELLLISLVAHDIFVSKGYKNWYFLESFRNEVNVTFSQKKERKFLFFKRNIGLNLKKQFTVKGYFLRIDNENI